MTSDRIVTSVDQKFDILFIHHSMHMCVLEWRWNAADDGAVHRQIISYFGDTANAQCPFSIQKLISIGRESGRKAGDWYGPASIANALWCDFCTLWAVVVWFTCYRDILRTIVSSSTSSCPLSTVLPMWHFSQYRFLVPSSRQHRSNSDCLEKKRKIIRTFVCYIVYHSCAQWYAHTY